MKWREETDFKNIAEFLGNLFDANPEDINKQFVNINEMYVLKFIDDDDAIHGIMITVRDNKEPSIAELLYTAFEQDFDFDKFKPFQRLVNFSKIEYLDIIYTNTYITENSFVNVDLDVIGDFLTTFERVSMNLSKENYKTEWYDETGEKLDLQEYDYIKTDKSLKLAKEKSKAKFKTISLKELSIPQIATLQSKVYSSTKFEDNLHILSKEKPDYNTLLVTRTLNNYYGEIDEETSSFVMTDKGELAGYIICLKPFIKGGFISDIAVDPSFQDYGLGRVLFRNAIIKYFEKHKCENVGVVVTLENDNVVDMYLRNGFEIAESGKEGILIVK